MPTKARRPGLCGFVASCCATLALVPGSLTPSRAGDGASYTIPAGEGYGIGDCLHAGNDCGRVIADSWCEAHGHAHAIAYGSSDDVTGTIKASDKMFQVAAGDIVIRCGD